MKKKFCFGFVVLMVIGTLYFGIFQYDSSRILTYLAVIPVLGAPVLVWKTKFCLGDKELCCYYLFVFLAYFLGCVVNLYQYIWWYDSLVHFFSGIFSFGVGLFLVDKLEKVQVDAGFLLFFCLCFVMFVAGIWELFEFGADSLLKMNLQHAKETGVGDSMIDMISALCGGFFSIGVYVKAKK